MQDETEFFQHMRESVRQMSLVSRRIEGARFAVVNWGLLRLCAAAEQCKCTSQHSQMRLLSRTAHMSITFINAAAEGNMEQASYVKRTTEGF